MLQRRPKRERARHIAIVAPESDYRMLEVSLSRLGYEVDTLPTDHASLQRIEDKPPDLLIVGVHYGQHHGLNILKALNSRLSPPILVIATDHQILADIVAHPETYACDYTLSSPTDLQRLYAVVEELIGPPT